MEPRTVLGIMIDLEILLTVCQICVAFELGIAQEDRVMDETPLTVNVISGSTAILPCSVEPKYTEGYGDQYSVLWQNPIATVISIKDRRVLTDMRISVERPFVTDWNLHIRNVSVTDSGEYKCQINTDPVRSKTVKLFVQVPPAIVDFSDSDDVTARVSDNVELMCNATGIPKPSITWYRLNVWGNKKREKVGHEGEILRIYNISRVCADTYECVANNSVPPSRNRQIQVTVEYPPEIRLLTSRIAQHIGKETILECVITASPLGVTMWKKDGLPLGNSFKYELDVYNEGPQTITLSLRIAHLDRNDFGNYVCEASNSLGRASKVMELYEIRRRTTTTAAPTTTTTTLPRHIIDILGDDRKDKRPNNYNGKTWQNGDNEGRGRNNQPINTNQFNSGQRNHNRNPSGASLTGEDEGGVYGTGSVNYKGQAGIPGTSVFMLCLLTVASTVVTYS